MEGKMNHMNRRYCNAMVHVIKQGDTLYQLSRKYRVPLALILRANPYVNVYNLQVGQEICIPIVRPYNWNANKEYKGEEAETIEESAKEEAEKEADEEVDEGSQEDDAVLDFSKKTML